MGNLTHKPLDLIDYWRIIRKRWRLIVVLPIIVTLTAAILNFFVLKPVYEATATVIVGRQANSQAAPTTYQTIAKSRTLLSQVQQKIGSNVDIDALQNAISVRAMQNTEIVSISVQDTNAQKAADLTNLVSAEFTKRIVELKKVGSAGIADQAVAPNAPVKPKKAQNVMIALIFGLLVSLGLAFLLEFMDNKVKTPEEIEELTGMTILGTIPEFSTAK